jgi:hypothetical protein
MKRVVFFLVVLFSWAIADGQGHSKTISLVFSDREIIIDGLNKKGEWESIDSIAGFSAPWSSIGYDQTVFKCFCSNTFFYFYFDVIDNTIITYNFEEELTVAKEDRVELFFSAKSDLSKYYCIEMDPLGRKLDYSAQFYRKFEETWNFNQVDIAARITPDGYVVEGRIPLSELENLGIKESFYLGIFRADFTGKRTDEVNWYSWIDPKCSAPDFHIPTALGKCSMKKH